MQKVETWFNRTQISAEGKKLGEPISDAQKAHAATMLAMGWTPGMVVASMANSRMADIRAANGVDLGPPANQERVPIPQFSRGAQPQLKSMPVSTLNGWTSSGLLPSSTVVNQILSRASPGMQAPAPVAPPAGTPGAPLDQGRFSAGGGAIPTPGAGYIPLPSVPPQQPPGFGGGSRGPGYGDVTGGRGWVNPALTPEQAYSQYLQMRSFADTTTPLQASINAMMGAQNALAYSSAGDPNRNGLNYDPYGATLRNNVAAQIMGAQRASPYAYSYGTPAANAPAPQPAQGYVTGYGSAPGGGFGFGGGGGFGF